MRRAVHCALLVSCGAVLGLASAGSGCSSSSTPQGTGGDASMEGGGTGLDSGGPPATSGDDGSADAGEPDAPDATAYASADATTYFIAPVQLQGACSGTSCLCLPQALPVDGTGQAACQLFFELFGGNDSGDDGGGDAGDAGDAGDGSDGADGGDGSDPCAALGLQPAAPDVMQSIGGSLGSPSGPLCVLPQLSGSDLVDGSCVASSATGWCYVVGGAAGSCTQAIRVSPTGAPPAGAVALLGCGESAPDAMAAAAVASVGTPCTPSEELSGGFGGFSERQVTVEDGNPACPGAVCLVNHFQGLTSCPYGQDSQANPTNGASTDCTVPGSSEPVRPDAVVGGETVQPWCADRRADDVVTCSCRCANVDGGTDDGAAYCACPSGFTCAQVVAAVESGDPRAGGYCIKQGTAYAPSSGCFTTCNASSSPCP